MTTFKTLYRKWSIDECRAGWFSWQYDFSRWSIVKVDSTAAWYPLECLQLKMYLKNNTSYGKCISDIMITYYNLYTSRILNGMSYIWVSDKCRPTYSANFRFLKHVVCFSNCLINCQFNFECNSSELLISHIKQTMLFRSIINFTAEIILQRLDMYLYTARKPN